MTGAPDPTPSGESTRAAGGTGKRGFLDVRTPFFRPLWRRVVATGICFAWAAYEFSTGNAFWGMLFGGAGALMGWQFFVTFDQQPDGDPQETETPTKEPDSPG